MRVLLISEGTHEGHPDPARPQALEAIARRILPASAEFTWMSVRDLPRGNPVPGKGGGHFKLAMKAMWHGAKSGFDGLVMVTDADERHERIQQFEHAQASQTFSIHRALGIPVEKFDSWILADQLALSQVLGTTVQMQPSPEAIHRPKEQCASIMVKGCWTGSHAEFYERVCQSADLNVVASRCPIGFKPFYERLQALGEILSKALGAN